jgi:solute carrier family 13 (sodium-dependent dicarboxylate transporter), member 2/3/5
MDYAEYCASGRRRRVTQLLPNLHRVWRQSPRFCIAIALTALSVFAIGLFPGLSTNARITLIVFSFAVIGWTILDLDETPVAIGGALALVLFGVVSTTELYDALGDELIWLMLGGFILAAAMTQSGLAERFGRMLIAGANTVDALFTRVTWLIIATAFLIPSTSARAALLLPIFLGLVAAIDRPRITRALALLFPTVILLSACASLLGAGAHLVAVDFMRRMDATDAPGFLGWMLAAAPFAIIASFAAMKLVVWLFLTGHERAASLTLSDTHADARGPISAQQRRLVLICASTLLGWITTDLHGVDAALVAIAGSLAATVKAWTGIEIKSAIKKVEWNLILFLAGTLVLGDALQHSGAAQTIANAALALSPIEDWSEAQILALCALGALLSHIFITSRTVRAAVLIPAFAIPLASGGVSPTLLILVAVIGSGFCQTFVVSAKPVAVFAKLDKPTFTPNDLLALSAALLLPLFALLMLFATSVWPRLGY